MYRNDYKYKKTLGLKLPITLKSDYLESMDNSYDVMRQNLITFFMTEAGSRIMRPNLGIKIRNRLGDMMSDELLENLSFEIEEQLESYFKQIQIIDVTTSQPNDMNLSLRITYKMRDNINQYSNDVIEINIG